MIIVEEVLSVSIEDLARATRVLEAANLRQEKEELGKDEINLTHQLQTAIIAGLTERGNHRFWAIILFCVAIFESLGPIQPLALPTSSEKANRRCSSTVWIRADQAEDLNAAPQPKKMADSFWQKCKIWIFGQQGMFMFKPFGCVCQRFPQQQHFSLVSSIMDRPKVPLGECRGRRMGEIWFFLWLV